jgi:hypothetical protein
MDSLHVAAAYLLGAISASPPIPDVDHRTFNLPDPFIWRRVAVSCAGASLIKWNINEPRV